MAEEDPVEDCDAPVAVPVGRDWVPVIEVIMPDAPEAPAEVRPPPTAEAEARTPETEDPAAAREERAAPVAVEAAPMMLSSWAEASDCAA